MSLILCEVFPRELHCGAVDRGNCGQNVRSVDHTDLKVGVALVINVLAIRATGIGVGHGCCTVIRQIWEGAAHCGTFQDPNCLVSSYCSTSSWSRQPTSLTGPRVTNQKLTE